MAKCLLTFSPPKSCSKKLKGAVPSDEKQIQTHHKHHHFKNVLQLNACKHLLINKNFAFSARKCPTGWVMFQTSCYFTAVGKSTWNESRKYCQSKSADLAVVTTAEEMVCVAVCICLYLHDCPYKCHHRNAHKSNMNQLLSRR